MPVEHYSALSVSENVPLHLTDSAGLPSDAVITGESPAVKVMHDFRRTSPAVLRDTMPLREAARMFEVARVRYFLVENSAGVFQGVISLKDTLMNPRLVAMMHENYMKVEDLQVRDAMTPRKHIHVVPFESLRHAKVGDILRTMDKLGESYLCVSEHNDTDLRGFFCAAEIAKWLGQRTRDRVRARTFSELKLTLLEGHELES